MKILIVENHADTLESLREYLADSGYEVLTAMTVSEATRLLTRTPCDVVLCDIGLPDGTGWDLMLAVQHLPRKMCAIAMSGFGTNADNLRSREAGFQFHLLKPFKGAELDRILREVSRHATPS